MNEASTTDCDAIVIALKSRSQPVSTAVRDSLSAAYWLKNMGAEKLYFKYCSTFDSTPQGNIGPVADALLEASGHPFSLLCPSLLENGRAVRNGMLYVNGVPLSKSHMKHHPLNPMWNSRIPALMKPQSKYPVFVVSREEMKDEASLVNRLKALSAEHDHFYLVPDYDEPDDGSRIAALFDLLPLWTGGSELLLHFAKQHSAGGQKKITETDSDGSTGRLMFCGSCSDMTQKQVNRWLIQGGKGRMIVPEDGKKSDPELWSMAEEYLKNPQEDYLFYSSGSVGFRDTATADAAASAGIESVLSRLAAMIARQIPADRVIVAGGETSGSVIKALGLHVFSVGPSIAPGVPILYPQEKKMKLVLKSGNFGDEDFFLKTLNEQEK